MELLGLFVAFAAVFSGYRLWVARVKKGKKLSDLRGWLACFALCLLLLWCINIYIGFIR